MGAALCAGLLLQSSPAATQDGLRVVRDGGARMISVPLDQAVVLESERPFAEISIAQPEVADVAPLSERSVYILGRRAGRTSLTLTDATGAVIASAIIAVDPDVEALKERLAALLPGEPVEVRATQSGVALSGVVSGAAAVDGALSLARAYVGDGVTNLLSVGGSNQVALRVRIAEVKRSVGKELGLSLGVAATTDRARVGAGTNRVRPTYGADAVGLVRAASTGFGVLDAIFSVGESLLLDISIDALERKGFARTLAEPNLVAQSGGQADFLAGGEVPIPSISAEGEISVDFKPVGVKLGFVPVVLAEERISVAVAAEVASVDPALGTSTLGVDIPGFSVRRASTTVELEDGQSFAIAGLYQDDFADRIRQVPWLGDLPVLGALFRSVDFQRGETELVIIVTAELVEPVGAAERLATPLENTPIPTERDLFLFGSVEGLPPAEARLVREGLDGAYGYVVD